MSEPSFEETLAARRDSSAQTVHEVSAAELQALLEKLFFDEPDHPWAMPFTEFVREHSDDKVYAGETSDGFSFVFYPSSLRGFWYRYDGRLVAIGRLSDQSLNYLAGIV